MNVQTISVTTCITLCGLLACSGGYGGAIPPPSPTPVPDAGVDVGDLPDTGALPDTGDLPDAAPGAPDATPAPGNDGGNVTIDAGTDAGTNLPAGCNGGPPCSAVQFCDGTQCVALAVSNVCSNRKAIWVTDQYAADNTAGSAIGAALQGQGCGAAVTSVNEASNIAMDTATGRPIAGTGNSVVTGGGWFGHNAVKYMDTQLLTPLSINNDGTNVWVYDQRTSTNLLFVPESSVTAHHDYFIVELAVEPMSGTLCLFAYGMQAVGTVAAGYYFQNMMMPSLATYTDVWYTYEWTDTNNDGLPNAGDAFVVKAQGQ